MKYILRMELKLTLKSMLLWGIVIGLLSLFGMLEYPFISKYLGDFMPLLEGMPKIVMIMFGIYKVDFTTPVGYYVCMYFWCTLLTYVHAAYIGGSIISKEQRNRTAEYLFSKPYSRTTVVLAKGAAAAVNVLIISLFTAAFSMVTIFMVGVSGSELFMVFLSLLGMFVTQLVIAAMAFLCSAAFNSYKRGMLAAIGMLIIFYLLFFALEYREAAGIWNVLSPIRYFDAKEVVASGLSSIYLLFSALVITVCVWLTCRIYKKKEFGAG